MSRNVLGMDQRITLEWLDFTAAKVLQGFSKTEVREELFDLLDGVVGGRRQNSARSKTVTVLTRIWSAPPPERASIQQRALKLMPEVGCADRVVIHWAMASASYMFFHDVSSIAGRFLQLQGDVSQVQVVRRMQELWGERSTLTRATQRAMNSMVLWGILRGASEKGVFRSSAKLVKVSDPAIAELLLEALLLRTETATLPVESALRHPSFFPFTFQLDLGRLRRLEQFEVYRQGLDTDVVGLAKALKP